MAGMFALTLLGWVIFRCHDLSAFGRWLAALGHWQALPGLGWGKPFLWVLLHAGPLLLLQAATWRARDEVEFAHWSWPVRGVIYFLMFALITSSTAGDVEFIYFQF